MWSQKGVQWEESQTDMRKERTVRQHTLCCAMNFELDGHEQRSVSRRVRRDAKRPLVRTADRADWVHDGVRWDMRVLL